MTRAGASASRVASAEPFLPAALAQAPPPAATTPPTTTTMDRESTYALSLFGTERNENEDSNSQIQQLLVDFVLDFHIDNVFIYRYDWPDFAQ